jgi:hypothetical protein
VFEEKRRINIDKYFLNYKKSLQNLMIWRFLIFQFKAKKTSQEIEEFCGVPGIAIEPLIPMLTFFQNME